MDEESTLTLGYEIEIEVTLDYLADRLSEDYILGAGKNPEFAYLAALSLETLDSREYDIERVIMEFLRNSQDVDLTREECNEIEEILR